jgi:hypothetical protein
MPPVLEAGRGQRMVQDSSAVRVMLPSHENPEDPLVKLQRTGPSLWTEKAGRARTSSKESTAKKRACISGVVVGVDAASSLSDNGEARRLSLSHARAA